MQLSPVTRPATIAAGAADAAAARAPRFSGGLSYSGEGKFSEFVAKPKGGALGEADGYATLDGAVTALTMLTVGAALPAAGIYEREGRFHGRALHTEVVFESGAKWVGPWRLEQHPDDLAMFDGTLKGAATRTEALRAVVDGAQHLVLDAVPTK